jgi:hypothetical protein
MSRNKIIKRKVPIAGGKDMSEALNNLLGGAKDIGVIYPKYSNIATHLEKIREVIRELCNVPIFKAEKWKASAAALDQYCMMIDEHLAEHFSIMLGQYMLDLSKSPQELQERVFASYDVWKAHPLTTTLIKTCDSLHKYRDALESPSIEFVLNIAGTTWEPLAFIRLNFKDLFIDISGFATSQKMANVIFAALKLIYDHTHEIYNIRISPDIDGDKFVETILQCVEQLRKNPRLSRCTKALNKIVSSAELLKTRLSGYYRDFVETNDSSIIMQNFISDVSETCGDDDIHLINEFRQIAQYFNEVQAQNPQGKNPETKKLFAAVMENINKISEMAPNLQEKAKAATSSSPQPKQEPASQKGRKNALATMTAEEIAKLPPSEIQRLMK